MHSIGRVADDGAVRDYYPEDTARDAAAEPGVYAQTDADATAAVLLLDVGGEVFEVRADGRGGTEYVWSSGPNPGYGFGLSPTPDMSLDEHRGNVRNFLAEIDPATGYFREG